MKRARRKANWALLAIVMMAWADPFQEGIRAYQEGKYAEALKAFAQAESDAGESASPELLYNKALAALQAGEIGEAESAAEKAAVRGGKSFSALRDFLLGNSAFARAEKAEAIANSSEAEPNAIDQALSHAESARSFWQQAATSKPDWAEARRNVERALLKIEELKKKKEEAEKKKKQEQDQNKDQNENPEQQENQDKKPEERQEEKKQPENKDEEKPKSNEAKQDEQKQESEKAEPPKSEQTQKPELSPEQIKRLIEKLQEKEREKQEIRKAQRKRKTPAEKDW